MFIAMLSQPDFDSYDLSTLRGGKFDNSNRKWENTEKLDSIGSLLGGYVKLCEQITLLEDKVLLCESVNLMLHFLSLGFPSRSLYF